MTLFVPPGVDGFVSYGSGDVTLDRVLLPVDHSPRPALDTAAAFARRVGGDRVTMRLLHVGTAATQPRLHLPQAGALVWETHVTDGDVVDRVLDDAAAIEADLIVLTTGGRSGLLEALRGSTSERIIRGARCPILTIPAGHR
jgi:nucleotide-binding universal stress UspA family protein